MSPYRFFSSFYQDATRPQDLGWFTPEPPRVLQQALERRPGCELRILDLGCGAGNHSIWLAKRGHRVTGVDFVENAIDIAKTEATQEGVSVDFIRGDVLEYSPDGEFDVIYDRGCLHCLESRDRPAYRKRIMSWLSQDGDYVLVHFGRVVPFDWRPVGPRRRSRREIRNMVAPELTEQAHMTHLERSGLPMGPIVRLNEYWFRP